MSGLFGCCMVRFKRYAGNEDGVACTAPGPVGQKSGFGGFRGVSDVNFWVGDLCPGRGNSVSGPCWRFGGGAGRISDWGI